MKLRLGLVALLVAATISPRHAMAQGAIGATIYNSAVQDRVREIRRKCEAGVPPEAKWVARAEAITQQVMTDYFALTSKSDKKALKHVFAVKEPDLSWKSPEGKVPVADLGSRLDTPIPSLTRIAFVLSNNVGTARGIWQARYDDPTRKPEYYAVDFIFTVPDFLFQSDSYRILHLTIVPGDEPPPLPTPYCHLELVRPW